MGEILKTRLGEMTKKYDRSVAVVLTALGVLSATYLGAGRYLNSIVEATPVVIELKRINAVQAEKNGTIEKRVDSIDRKIDRIYEYVTRR